MKYITAFILLLFFSFAVIISILTSVINNYSKETKEEVMKNITLSACEYFEGQLRLTDDKDLPLLISENKESVDSMLSVLASYSDHLTIVISDKTGKIIHTFGVHASNIEELKYLPADFVEYFGTTSGDRHDFLWVDTKKQIFDTPHIMYSDHITADDGSIKANVLVFSSTSMMSDLLSVIMRSIILAILWVMLAAFIAIYLISERIIHPLKEISRAAKSFAAGKLDVRVSVKGSDEVAELAAAFNNMAETLEASEKMRNTFVSNVSHDLRTPMTSISGFVDGILDGVIPPEKHKHYLKIVSEEVKRLSRLVVTLLDISKIQAGERKFTMAPFDICEMALQILFSFEKKIEEKNLNIVFDFDEENMTAIADRDAIYQILYNICDNAVKFSTPGGMLKVSVGRLKNRKYLIGIYNEGSGIPKEDLPHIFERFYKSDKSRGLDKTGVGLGLYICKTIIEAHDEEIWVESEEGKDCPFRFTLKAQ